jgi:hypothetical protein
LAEDVGRHRNGEELLSADDAQNLTRDQKEKMFAVQETLVSLCLLYVLIPIRCLPHM